MPSKKSQRHLCLEVIVVRDKHAHGYSGEHTCRAPSGHPGLHRCKDDHPMTPWVCNRQWEAGTLVVEPEARARGTNARIAASR